MTNWMGIIQETLMITSFVIIVMLLVEFVNIITQGSLIKLLNQKPYIQIMAGTLLGLIPGCMGSFAVVSLYSQNLLSFGALVATMIASCGDEAFFMLALIPQNALFLFLILAVIAFITGIFIDKFFKLKIVLNKNIDKTSTNHDCSINNKNIFSLNNISLSKYKAFLILSISLIILLTTTGWIGHSHSDTLLFSLPYKNSSEKIKFSDITPNHSEQSDNNLHESCKHDSTEDHSHNHEETDIIKIIIILSSILVLIIVLFSNSHFVEDHLWRHIILKHLPKIFLWTFATLILINIILNLTYLGSWIYNNYYIILLISIIIGIIPQSGPHLIFLILYIQGSIPFSILLANSIVQDGHGGLPLIAESKKSFAIMKIISICIALIIGVIGILIGF